MLLPPTVQCLISNRPMHKNPKIQTNALANNLLLCFFKSIIKTKSFTGQRFFAVQHGVFKRVPAQSESVMQVVIPNWQSVSWPSPGGNRPGYCGLPGYMADSRGGSNPGGNTLAQTNCTMKSPRNQNNGNAVGTVRTGIPFTADLGNDDALPRFHEQYTAENPSPREIQLSEEESFRDFLNSRLPKHKASQALRDKVRSTIEKNETW